jgi:integrase
MVQTVGQTRIQNPSYIVNRSGVYYYSRRVPLDLRGQFGKKRIMVSLKTKSRDRALASAMVLSEKIESFWNGLRLEAILSTQLPKKVTKGHSPSVNFLDALDIYLRLKGVGKGDNFIRTARRNITELVCYLGNRDISEVSSADAGGFRDHLFDKGLSSSSVKRCFASVRAITRLAITEQGLGIANPFAEIFIPADADKKKRPPIPNDVIQEIQAQCVRINDENRWLIALISDTGLRLSEALGLATADFYLDGPLPYVRGSLQPSFLDASFSFLGSILYIMVSLQPGLLDASLAYSSKNQVPGHTVRETWVTGGSGYISQQASYITPPPNQPLALSAPHRQIHRGLISRATKKCWWMDRSVRRSSAHATFQRHLIFPTQGRDFQFRPA